MHIPLLDVKQVVADELSLLRALAGSRRQASWIKALLRRARSVAPE